MLDFSSTMLLSSPQNMVSTFAFLISVLYWTLLHPDVVKYGFLKVSLFFRQKCYGSYTVISDALGCIHELLYARHQHGNSCYEASKTYLETISTLDFLFGGLSDKWTSETNPSLLLCRHIWPLVILDTS